MFWLHFRTQGIKTEEEIRNQLRDFERDKAAIDIDRRSVLIGVETRGEFRRARRLVDGRFVSSGFFVENDRADKLRKRIEDLADGFQQ